VAVVRPPAFTEEDLGPAGWRTLHELARLHGDARVSKRILPLVRWALYRYLAGDNVELTRAELEALYAEAAEVYP
jgi:hypothetical protein